MHLLHRMLYILICLTINTASVLSAELNDVIDVESESVYPINYKPSPNSSIQGYAFDLVKALMEESELKHTIRIYPWSRAYKNATSKKNVIIYPIGRTELRENQFNWIGEIVPLTYSLFCRKDKASADISIEKIKKMKIGIPRNGLRADYLKSLNFKNLLFTTGNRHTHKLLMRGRIDCMVASKWGLDQLKDQYEIKEGFLIKYQNFGIPETHIYIAISIQTDSEIVHKLKQSYKTLVANGTYIKIMQPLIDDLN